MANLIEVKQKPDQSSQAVGLSKYNRSKMPGCWERFQPGIGKDGRWITGLDENSYLLKQIPDIAAREERKEEIKTKRQQLEALTGKNLAADSSNEFWGGFLISITDKMTLDMDNPYDQIMYHVMQANNFSAPEIALADSPDYLNAKYYFSRTEEEQINLAYRKRERNKAISKLESLYENKNRLTLVAKYILGGTIKNAMSVDTLYNLMSDYLNDPEDRKNLNSKKFLTVADKTIEDLQVHITTIDAVTLGVIRLREGLYQRGNITLGKTLEEVTKFLAQPSNSIELESILEEVREKRIQ